MPTPTLVITVLASVAVLSDAPLACSRIGPTYIGERSANPEQETFAYLVTAESERPLGFIGPAGNVGPITGDIEKDTIAYRPLLGVLGNAF